MKFSEYTPNVETRKKWGWTRKLAVKKSDHPFSDVSGIIHKDIFTPRITSEWTAGELRAVADLMDSVKGQ